MNKIIDKINFSSNLHKIRLGLHLGAYLEDYNICYYPAVYLASGLDLEFPLVLRARRIIMIDPIFQDENNINKILEKIMKYDQRMPELKKINSFHHNITFNFDFGFGPEKVVVDLFAKTYQEFEYLSPIGYIIEFNNQLDHGLYKSELLEKLILNGVIIDNQESPLRHKSLSITDILFPNDDLDDIERRKAAGLGLKTLRFSQVPFAIYQKIRNTSKLLHLSYHE